MNVSLRHKVKSLVFNKRREHSRNGEDLRVGIFVADRPVWRSVETETANMPVNVPE